jgi:SAM-dependent methyltransferase
MTLIRNAYGDFARYYDYLGWDKFARSAATRLRSFIRLQGGKYGKALDFACGTGELEKLLKDTGIRFTGVDASPGMLKVARRKCPGVRFILSDVGQVRLKRKFDLVLFLFDSANHMNSLSHLRRVFKNAHRHLRPGGYFIFDILTESGLERWEHVDIRRGDDYTVIANGYYYPEKLVADIFIEAFVRRGKLYERVYQKVVGKAFPTSDVFDALSHAGFERILASSYNPAVSLEEASRLWLVCS